MEAQSFVLMWPSHVCLVAENLLNINYHALQGFHSMRKGRDTESAIRRCETHGVPHGLWGY